MPRALLLLVASLTVACAERAGDLTIEVPSQAAARLVERISVTAFVPLRVPVDSDVPSFIEPETIGVFFAAHSIDPATIERQTNIGRVLLTRESSTYPLDGGDWVIDVPAPDTGDPNNPWGAVMLHVEARGDVNGSAEGPTSTETLLAGSRCVRTEEASHTDIELDRAIKRACRLLGSDEAPDVVALEPVPPDVFRIEMCEGPAALTAVDGATLRPAVCVRTVLCESVATGSEPCFDCPQPCPRLTNKSGVPISFEVERPGAAPIVQVVGTDEDGRAEAAIPLEVCAPDAVIHARVVGRDDPVTIAVDCVDRIEGFTCTEDRPLAPGFQVRSISTVPTAPGAPDRLAVLSDDGDTSRLEVFSPGGSIVRTFDEDRAVAVHGFFYTSEPDVLPQRVAVAVAVADDEHRLYAFEIVGDELVDGTPAGGLLPTLCGGWFCGGTQEACQPGDPDACGSGEACYEGRCVGDESNAMCLAPAGCECQLPNVKHTTRGSFTAHDIDRDGFADVTFATSDDIVHLLHRTATAPDGALFDTGDCECGRYRQANAVVFGRFDGEPDGPDDLVVASEFGMFVKAGEAQGRRTVLTCGNLSSVSAAQAVHDATGASLSCRSDETCLGYDDVVTVSDSSELGGTDGPGVVRVVFGGYEALPTVPPADRRQLLSPRPAAGPTPMNPRRVAIGDFNADAHLDIAVLYAGTREIHVWAGASNRTFDPIAPLNVERCAVARSESCSPLEEMAIGDFDGDGADDIAALCGIGVDPSIRTFSSGR